MKTPTQRGHGRADEHGQKEKRKETDAQKEIIM